MDDAVVDLVLVEQFLNTLDERTFSRHGQDHTATDELTSVQGLEGWLQRRGLVAVGQELGSADITAARALRAALREALTTGGDGAQAADALAAFPLRLKANASGRLGLESANNDAAGLGAIVEAVAVSVANGRWTRLKLCASPDCRWAFYDTSRNGGGRWCSMQVCGNRHKTRTYRQRQLT